MSESGRALRVGVIGARGYVGEALLPLLVRHAGFDIALLGSRGLAGKSLRDITGIGDDIRFESLAADEAARREVDLLVLALPNGLAADYVDAVERIRPNTRIIDLSADYRFDPKWDYGLPERRRGALVNARRVANPGCYATAMQLAIDPLLDISDADPVCFGVSGYSGAGTTPSPRNDPERLRDNLMPYALTGHLHEREVSEQLGTPVRFVPHVAGFFRGISMTVSMDLAFPADIEAIAARYQTRYAAEPLIAVSSAIPQIADVAGRPGAIVGGFAAPEDSTRVVLVSVLDNLLKGAATQALQNMNLMCGFDELEGIVADA